MPTNPYGTYIDPKTNQPVSLAGTLGEQNLEANKLGYDWKPNAVVTSDRVATTTKQNITDLTTAQNANMSIGRANQLKGLNPDGSIITPEQKAAQDKALTDKLAAETAAKEKSAVDTAIAGTPTKPVQSQAEIDAQAGITATQAEIKKLQANMDAQSAALMSSISAEYDSLVAQQAVQNTAYQGGVTTEGLVSGRARYAPIMQAGILDRAVASGLGEISKLQAKKSQLLIQAQQARDERQFKYLNETMQDYRTTVKEERAAAQTAYENVQKASAEARKSADLFKVEQVVSEAINANITDPNAIFSAISGAGIQGTTKEVSDALKNLMPAEKSVGDLPADAKMLTWLKQTGQLAEDATVFDMYRQETNAKATLKTPTGVKIGAGGGSSDIGDFMFFQSALPARLKDSDAEKANLREYFNDAKTRGMTPFEMMDEMIGYRITEPSAFSEGMRNYALAHLDSQQTAAIGRLINNKQYGQAINVVETEAYKKVRINNPETFVSEAETRYVHEKSNEIQKTLESYGFFDVIGPFTGTFDQAMGRLGRVKGAELKAKIINLTQQMQKKQAGSALTEDEWKRILEPVVPLLTDKRGTFEAKVKEGKNSILQHLNSERGQAELPMINEQELMNRDLRVASYSSFESKDPMGLGGGTTQSSTDNPLGI